MKQSLTILLVISLLSLEVTGQQLPSFKPLRYNEDYGYLKKDSLLNWYEKMKFSPLSMNGSTYVSYGGEARFQYFYTLNEEWGDAPEDNDGYVLSRYLIHADLHAGEHFRTFVELQSSLSGGRINPSPVDDNPLDLHQAFIDLKINPSSASTLVFRLGRQEFLYGSQRLVSVREGPNNRQSFDGARILFATNKYKADVFYSHYVAAKPNIFDDKFNKNTKFWGAYIVRNQMPLLRNIDFYYLGLWKRNFTFDDGEGTELRHSIGTRIWNNEGDWYYNIEALYQFGTFATKNIKAWTFSIDAAYTFSEAKLKPRLGLRTELISGDKYYDDNKLQTFNPLFPRGAYFGYAALIGPNNLIDVHPLLTLSFTKKMDLEFDYDAFWRYSRNDGLYGINGLLTYSGRDISSKYIGGQSAMRLSYDPNNFINFTYEFTWFNAGDYLKAAGAGKDILFTGITAQFKF